MKKLFAAAVLCLSSAGGLQAGLHTGDLDYKDGAAQLRGYAAYEEAGGSRPGVLIVHDWSGVGPYVKERARQLASMGYVVLAADIYGREIRPASQQEAARQAGIYRADRALMRARAAAGLAALKRLPGVDPSRTAVMGYCFGGGVALELARSGAEIKGAASFHGNLDTPNPADAGNIKGKIAVFHGSDDPHVSTAAVAAFQEEMRAAGADWQLVTYGGAVHSFSNPGAGGDPKTGSAYNEKADKRSWRALQDFFSEVLAP